MVFSKDLDVVSPLLYQHASGGTTFGEVTIEFFRADGEGNRVKYLEVKLKNAILSEVDSQVAAEGIPTDTFSPATRPCSGSTPSRRAPAARAATRRAPGA